MTTFLARHRLTFMAGLLVTALYGVSLWFMPKHVFWMPDEGAKLFELHATSLSWSEGVTYRIPFAGQRLVPGDEFLPGFDVFPTPTIARDGSLYLAFDTPVVFPLLSAPFFHAFGAAGLYVIPMLSGCLIAFLAGVMAAWLAPGLGPVAVLLVGLGTPVWFYSLVFWEHTLATVLALLAVCLLVRAPRRLESVLLAIPPMLLATILRSEMATLAVALAVAWVVVLLNSVWHPATAASPPALLPSRLLAGRRRVLLSVGLIVAFGVALNASLTVRHRGLLGHLPERIGQALSGVAHLPQGMLEVYVNSENLGPTMGGLWLAAASLALLLSLAAPWIRSGRAQAVMTVAALATMLLCSVSLAFASDPYRGLHGFFPVAPFLILWPYGLRHAWRRGDAALLVLGTASWVYLLLIVGALALTYMHQGKLEVGMEWGQRYLLTAYPMMTVLALVGLRSLRSAPRPAWLWNVAVPLVALLFAAAVVLELRGLRMLHGTRSLMAKWDAAMRAEGPILTSVWWIVPAVADLFVTHEMFFSWRAGVAHWVERARQNGVTSFTLAHTEPITDEQLNAPGLRRVSKTPRMIAGGLLLTRFAIDALPEHE